MFCLPAIPCTRIGAYGALPLPEIVEALGALPVTAVVTLGSLDGLAEWTGPRPATTRSSQVSGSGFGSLGMVLIKQGPRPRAEIIAIA